jgi:hypothetical protein
VLSVPIVVVVELLDPIFGFQLIVTVRVPMFVVLATTSTLSRVIRGSQSAIAAEMAPMMAGIATVSGRSRNCVKSHPKVGRKGSSPGIVEKRILRH